jgi:hypothetical protein
MIFESMNNDIENDISDICFDIKDLGYTVNIQINEYKDNPGILELVVDIFNFKIYPDFFTFNEDVKNVVLRIYQYMRELGWYSNLSINSGIRDIKKKFYIRPDEKMRTEDIIEIEENYPRVRDIQMIFTKKVTQ